jgi:hypothetical protein
MSWRNNLSEFPKVVVVQSTEDFGVMQVFSNNSDVLRFGAEGQVISFSRPSLVKTKIKKTKIQKPEYFEVLLKFMLFILSEN